MSIEAPVELTWDPRERWHQSVTFRYSCRAYSRIGISAVEGPSGHGVRTAVVSKAGDTPAWPLQRGRLGGIDRAVAVRRLAVECNRR